MSWHLSNQMIQGGRGARDAPQNTSWFHFFHTVFAKIFPIDRRPWDVVVGSGGVFLY